MDVSVRFLDDLRDAVGPQHVLTDADVVAGYTSDWTGRFVGSTPGVVRPSNVVEVAAIIEACRRADVAIVPQGGNTGLVGGSVPLAGELVLSTERMTAITDVDADSGQLTAGAGATLAAVQTAATEAGWRYGVDLAARDSATVGGMIATNAGGLRVIRHGSTRRQVLGVEAVTGSGRVIRRLDGLVKDNTGYDLAGLLCGSEGTLGIVCRARLALVAPPIGVVTALLGFADIESAVRAGGLLRRSVAGLEAVEMVLAPGAFLVSEVTGSSPVLDPIPPVQLLVEAVGPPDPTDSLSAVIDEVDGVLAVAVATDVRRSQALWHVRDAHTEAIARVGIPLKFDVTLPSRRLAGFCREVVDAVAEVTSRSQTWLFGHLADGNVHVNVTGWTTAEAERIERAVLARVAEAGGSISAEHGIGTAKRAWLTTNRGTPDVEVMAAIKRALDPDGICNPGVLLPLD